MLVQSLQQRTSCSSSTVAVPSSPSEQGLSGISPLPQIRVLVSSGAGVGEEVGAEVATGCAVGCEVGLEVGT